MGGEPWVCKGGVDWDRTYVWGWFGLEHVVGG